MKTNIMKFLGMSAVAAAFLPMVASAHNGVVHETQTAAVAHAPSEGLFGVLARANELIGQVLPFIITLTLLVFLWGVFKFVVSGGNMEARKEARGYILWGIIALAVMVSVWGLVNILVRTVGVDNTPPPAPQGIQGQVQIR